MIDIVICVIAGIGIGIFLCVGIAFVEVLLEEKRLNKKESQEKRIREIVKEELRIKDAR